MHKKRPHHESVQLQIETATRHDLRFVPPNSVWDNIGDADEVYIHLVGATDVRIKLSYSQLERLRKGDPRILAMEEENRRRAEEARFV